MPTSRRIVGHDFSGIPLDATLKPEDFPSPEQLQTMQSCAAMIVRLVENEPLTLRELLARFAGGRRHFTFAGTPEQVADLIANWFTNGAANGFNIMPPVLPAMLDWFIDEIIPLLQRSGLFRTAYRGTTLRDHFGTERPSDGF